MVENYRSPFAEAMANIARRDAAGSSYGAPQRSSKAPSDTAQGEVLRWFTDPSGRRIPFTAPSGADHITKSKGARYYTDPGTGEPVTLDMNAKGGVSDPWATATVKTDAKSGEMFKELSGFGKKSLGIDPVWQNAKAQKELSAELKEQERDKREQERQQKSQQQAGERAAEAEKKRQASIAKIGIGEHKAMVEQYDDQFAGEVRTAKEKARLNAADIRSDETRLGTLKKRIDESKDSAERKTLAEAQQNLADAIEAKRERQEELELETRRAALRKEAWDNAKPAMEQAIRAAERQVQLNLLTNTGRHEVGPPGAIRNPDPKPGEPAWLPAPKAEAQAEFPPPPAKPANWDKLDTFARLDYSQKLARYKEANPGAVVGADGNLVPGAPPPAMAEVPWDQPKVEQSQDGFRPQPDEGKPLLPPGMKLLPNGQAGMDALAEFDAIKDNIARMDDPRIGLRGAADSYKGQATRQFRVPIAGRTVPADWLTDKAAIAQRTAQELGKTDYHLPDGYAVANGQVSYRGVPAGRVARAKFGLPRIYGDAKHSPSLASGNPYDGVPEYAEVAPQFRDELRTQEGYDQDEAGIQEQWAARAWSAGKVKGFLDKWQASNDSERADLLAEVDPDMAPEAQAWKDGRTTQMPRLNVAGLYRSGQISLQEARQIERTLYGIQPGQTLDAAAHFKNWRQNGGVEAEKLKQSERLMSGWVPLLGSINQNRKLEAFNQAFREWQTEYLAQNEGRLDFDREAFLAQAQTISAGEFNWFQRLGAWQERGMQNVAGSLIGMLDRAQAMANLVPAALATTLPKGNAVREGVLNALWGTEIDRGRLKELSMRFTGEGKPLAPEEVKELKAMTFANKWFDGRKGGLALSPTELKQGLDDTIEWVKGVGTQANRVTHDILAKRIGGRSMADEANSLFDAIDKGTLTRTQLETVARRLEDRAFMARGWPSEWREQAEGLYDASNDASPLARMLAAYRQTGDQAYRDQFTSMLLSTPQQMALQAELSEYASNNGLTAPTDAFAVFNQSRRSMRVAGLQEFGSEVLGDVVGAGVGKMVLTAGRGVSRMARAGMGASRVARVNGALDRILGVGGWRGGVTKTLALGVAGGSQEYLEEGFVALGEPTANLAKSFHAAGMEGLAGGVAMGVQNALLGAGMIGFENYKDTKVLKEFVTDWNKRTPDDPITVSDARQARAYLNPTEEAAHDEAVFKATMELAFIKQRGAANQDVLAGAPDNRNRGLTGLTATEETTAIEALEDLATAKQVRIQNAINAVREVNGIADPALKQFADAALKVARGQPLTRREQNALEGARGGVPPGPIAQPMPPVDPKSGKPIEGLPVPPEPGQPLARRVPRAATGEASDQDGWIITDPGLEALRQAMPRTAGMWLPPDERSQELAQQQAAAAAQQAAASPLPGFASAQAQIPASQTAAAPGPSGAGFMASPGGGGAGSTQTQASPGPESANVPRGTSAVPQEQGAAPARFVVPVTITAASGSQRVQEIEIAAPSPEAAAQKVAGLPAWRAIQNKGAKVEFGEPRATGAAETAPVAAAPSAGQPTEQTAQQPAQGPEPISAATWQEQAEAARAQVKPLSAMLREIAAGFGYKVVDTGLPFGFTDRYGDWHSFGTQIWDKAVPGSDIGQWIDKIGNSPLADAIREHMTAPQFHRVWFGHDPLANIGAIWDKFGPTALPEWAFQLLKDSSTTAGIPLPGVQWLVHSGVVGDVAATEWLSMNMGEALGAGFGIVGTYKLFKRAKGGHDVQVGWALLGVAFKLVGGVLSANPVLILLGLADAAIVVGARRGWFKAGFQKARETAKQQPAPAPAAAAEPTEKARSAKPLDYLQQVPLQVAANAIARLPSKLRAKGIDIVVRLDAVLQRFAPMFPGGVSFNADPKNAAGFRVERTADGKLGLSVNLGSLIVNFQDTKSLSAIQSGVEEELTHVAAMSALSDREVVELWSSLPRDLQQTVWQAYHSASIADGSMPAEVPANLDAEGQWTMGHEFVRMLVQDSEFQGRVTEAIEASPTLGEKIIRLLQKLAGELRRLIAGIDDAEVKARIAEYESRVKTALKSLMQQGGATRVDLTGGGRSVVQGEAGAGGPSAAAPPSGVMGDTGTAYTDGNEAVEYRWGVVEADSLNVSNTDDGRINPSYPSELQPRDRTSAASEAQVNDIARNANFDRLSQSNSVGDGAPMIGPDGVVESGNGRVMGLSRAYRSGMGSIDRYRSAIADSGAAEGGISEADDRAYLAAVERGDMETAQKMVDEAAKAAGYDTTAFIATKEFPTSFNTTKNAVFLAATAEAADSYTEGDYSDRVRSNVFLRLGNSKVSDFNGDRWDSYKGPEKDTDGLAFAARKNGYDSATFLNVRDYGSGDQQRTPFTEYAVFTPSQIKSADPVTYDASGKVIPLSKRFNPQSDSILYASLRRPGQMPAGRAQPQGVDQFARAQQEAALSQQSVAANQPQTVPQRVRSAGVAGMKRQAAEMWANVISGQVDRLDYYAPGFRDLWLDAERKSGLARAAVNGVMEKLHDRAKAGFGYPAWWKTPAVWKRWKRFESELLPVSARLEAEGIAPDGSFIWKPFDMRAGKIPLTKVHELGKKAGDVIAVRGEPLVIGPLFEEPAGSFTGAGTMVKYHLLLRPMDAAAQQQVYDAFAAEYADLPVARELLDEWIMPGMAGAREIGPQGVRTAAFNRYALLDFFNEWPPELQAVYGPQPMPQLQGVEGYTPDLFTIRSLSYMLGGLARMFKSGARKMKTGAARESGNVRPLLEGFQIRLMEAHLEKVRLERRGRVLKAAARPMNQVPAGEQHRWLRLDDTFEKLYELAVAARNLDRKQYPRITGALNPAQKALMVKLVGEAYHLRGRDLAVPEAIFSELLGELALRDAENLVLKVAEWFLDRFLSAALAVSGYLAMNWLSNEIMKTSFMLAQAFKAGSLLTVAKGRQARFAFETAAHMLKGMVIDRFPLRQQRIRDIVPRELFDREQAIKALAGFGDGVLENLKSLNPGGAILAAFKAGNWDVGAKVQLAHALYRAYMQAAWRDAGRPGKTKAERETWMRNWLEQDAPATIHREVQLAAGLYLMDYQNVPRWMDAASWRPVVTNPDHPARGILLNQTVRLGIKLLIPFIRWQYSFMKAGKRQAWDYGLKQLIAGKDRTERAEAVGNLAALGTMLFIPGIIAALSEGGGDDDDDKLRAELIGRVKDLEGGKLPKTLQAKNRFNASAVLRILAARMGMDGLDFTARDAAGDESDLWLRYRNYPYIKEGIVLGLAALGEKEAFGQSWSSLFQEYATLGLGWQVAQTMFGNRDEFGTPESQLAGIGLDVASAPLVPHRLLRDVNAVIAPTDRRLTPSERLDYQPGVKEGLMSRIPGLRQKLPVEGKVNAPKILASNKSDVAPEKQAELAKFFGIDYDAVGPNSRARTDVWSDLMKLRSLGAGPRDVRVTTSEKTGKPMIAYPDPDTVRQKSAFWEAMRSISAANLLPVKREAYRKAVRGEKGEGEE